MKLIFFTKYTRVGASSRYRFFQYVTSLEAVGLQPMLSPLFDDSYLALRYANGRAGIGDLLRAFVRRLWTILTVPREAVVVIEKELLPWFPATLERWLVWRGCRVAVDYDDAIFHQYDQHPNPWVHRILGRKIPTIMRLAHTVIAGNEYLADYARRAGAPLVAVIPTVIDLARYPQQGSASASGVLTIGWIGSPTTSRYLLDIAQVLSLVCQDRRVRLRLVGSGPVRLPGVPLEVRAWSEETEVDEICSFDVGIMPLTDEPWARGKCGLKLIQYMGCGLPVVASPVGVNTALVEHGVNGFLAASPKEWEWALRTLASDPMLRHRMGQAGRTKVEREYSLKVTAPVLAGWLAEAAYSARV